MLPVSITGMSDRSILMSRLMRFINRRSEAMANRRSTRRRSGAVGDRQRLVVHLIGQYRLGVKSVYRSIVS
jgi:hypothetical protein